MVSSTQPPIDQALLQARLALFLSNPNPRVGCVLTAPDGSVLGLGHTQMAGGPHAEIMALHDAQSKGHSTLGATAWVTLEPCSHQGRTGPCCDALISAGIGKVVASCEDPNPLVAGNGFRRLSAAGIDVVVGPGAEASRSLNIGFFSRMVRQQPWVRMKLAASLDGQTALSNGVSQWITSAEARQDGHTWRARACAILTGIGTVLADNPRLDVRDVNTPRQPTLVLVDSHLQTPVDARLWASQREVWVYTAEDNALKHRPLEDKGAQITVLPDASGKVDLHAMIKDLGRRQINEVHVEAGYKLNGSLLRLDLVDELLVYLAPMLLGSGQGIANLGPWTSLAQGLALEGLQSSLVGPDLRVLAQVAGHAAFLGAPAGSQ